MIVFFSALTTDSSCHWSLCHFSTTDQCGVFGVFMEYVFVSWHSWQTEKKYIYTLGSSYIQYFHLQSYKFHSFPKLLRTAVPRVPPPTDVLFFLLFFKYSCLHFHPTSASHPTCPHLPPSNTPLWLCPCVLYTCSLIALPLYSPIIPPPSPFWVLSVCSFIHFSYSQFLLSEFAFFPGTS